MDLNNKENNIFQNIIPNQQNMKILVQSENELEKNDKPNINIESNAERIQEFLESKRFLNTMRSIQDNNVLNYEEIKLLPSFFSDMQEALKKSNENILELRDTIKDKINIEKKLRNKIKEYEKEIKSLRENNYKLKEKENEYKYQYERIIYEINNLKRDNKELISKIENYEENINSLNQVNGKLEQKNKKYKKSHGILQNEITSIEEHLKDIKIFQNQIKKMQSETFKMKKMIDDLETEKNNLRDENIQLLSTIKSLKNEMKIQLAEKITIVDELNSIKMKDRMNK